MKTIPVSPILAGILLCANANGQPGGDGGRQDGRRGGPHPMMQAWKAADADGDGFLTMAEFSRLPRVASLPDDKKEHLFKRLDKNGDGRIERRELGAAFRNKGKRPMPRLWELDTDKSGGVSYEEFSAGGPFAKLSEERRKKVFERLDTNGDGIISPADRPERPHGREGMGPGKRKDGEEPAPKRWNPRGMFKALDADGDGAVSFGEFRKGPMVRDLDEDEQEDRFMALDRNGDGKLTPDDFRKPQPPSGD